MTKIKREIVFLLGMGENGNDGFIVVTDNREEKTFRFISQCMAMGDGRTMTELTNILIQSNVSNGTHDYSYVNSDAGEVVIEYNPFRKDGIKRAFWRPATQDQEYWYVEGVSIPLTLLDHKEYEISFNDEGVCLGIHRK
jgi:hypothetical protein